MPTFLQQQCPLCTSAAEYCWVDYGNRKYFECPKCSHFQISKRAEQVLAERSESRRLSYAEMAPDAPAEHMLVILMPNHEQLIASRDPLHAAFVLKAELPLDCE
jgi:hypothetical protein